MRFMNTVLTIAGVTYNTADVSDGYTQPTAWSPAVISWGRRDSLERPEPATLAVRLTIPAAGPLPDYGDLVTVDTTPATDYEAGSPVAVFTGTVDGLSRIDATIADSDGIEHDVVDVRLAASDVLAPLGRARIGDEPWPEEQDQRRWERLTALLADRVTLTTWPGTEYATMRARDVDSTAPLDLLELTSNHTGEALVATRAGLGLEVYEAAGELLIDTANIAWIDPTGAALEELPASAIADAERTLDPGTVVSSVTIKHPAGTPGDYTDARVKFTNATAARVFGPADVAIDSDAVTTSGRFTERARRILAARARPQWRLPSPVRVVLSQLETYYNVTSLFTEGARERTNVKITGAPAEVSPAQRVIGGTLTLHGDPTQQALEIELEPSEAVGPRSVRLADVTEFPISSMINVNSTDAATCGTARRIT